MKSLNSLLLDGRILHLSETMPAIQIEIPGGQEPWRAWVKIDAIKPAKVSTLKPGMKIRIVGKIDHDWIIADYIEEIRSGQESAPDQAGATA